MSDSVAIGHDNLPLAPAAVIDPEPESAWRLWRRLIVYVTAASVLGAVVSGLPVKMANSTSIQGSRWATLSAHALMELGSATLLVAVMAVISWFAAAGIHGRSKLLMTVRVLPVAIHPARDNEAK